MNHSARWPRSSARAEAGIARAHTAIVAAAISCALAVVPAPTRAAAAVPALALDQVAPGVFVHIGVIEDWTPQAGGDVANLGFVVGSRCVAVIDTGGTPRVGLALRAAVERTTPLPVCYVINTHAHPDHLLGDIAFAGAGSAGAPAPKFVASARYVHALAAREPYYLHALQRDFDIALAHDGIVYPSVAVDAALDLDLDLGDRVLTLQAWPTAHTDNDLTVYDRRTRSLFTGDLLFVQHLPALDGSLRGWLAALAALQRLDVRTVVPGHGASGDDWHAAMQPQADYLNGLLRDTRAALRKHLTIQQAVDTIGIAPSADRWRLTDRFHRRNVTAAYAELEWEDDDTKPAPAGPAASAASARGS